MNEETTNPNSAEVTTTSALHAKYIHDRMAPDRAGLITKLLTHLGPKMDSTPAADRGRHGVPGGLCMHIDEIISWMLVATHNMPGGHKLSYDSIVTAAILHDLFKVTDGSHNPYYVPNILKNGQQSPNVPYKHNKDKYMNWGISPDNVLIRMSVSPDPLARYAYQMITTDRLESNNGILSSAVVYALEPDLWNHLTTWEQDAIKFYGMAFVTPKYKLQHLVNPLMTLLHCGDMLSSNPAK